VQELNLDALNGSSLTFWLHLAAIMLPRHDVTEE
jgi:hypothetical protein